MEKACPACHKSYAEIFNFCTICGVELEKAPNRCSEMKMSLCEYMQYKDEDMYCGICGSLTTYGLEKTKSFNVKK